jgi:hypothetical protein
LRLPANRRQFDRSPVAPQGKRGTAAAAAAAAPGRSSGKGSSKGSSEGGSRGNDKGGSKGGSKGSSRGKSQQQQQDDVASNWECSEDEAPPRQRRPQRQCKRSRRLVGY